MLETLFNKLVLILIAVHVKLCSLYHTSGAKCAFPFYRRYTLLDMAAHVDILPLYEMVPTG
jgi:hypothetical protein